MNCPTCGARNPEAASWCTQCFVTLETPTDVADTAVTGSPPGPEPATTATTAAAASARSGDVRATGELVEWRCRRCDGWNVLESAQCAACGAPREGFATATPATAAKVPVGTARLASVVLPGLGHVLQGSAGSGVARMVLFVLWVGGGLALVGNAPLGGAVLLVGAAVLWAATIVDVERAPTGRRELLGVRGLGMLVAIITLLLVLGVGLRVVGG